jgi:hypothetical protein
MAPDLQISPSELKFRFELRKTIPVTLSLSNTGKEKIAFKVKTTSPKKYCVRPSSGVVEPGNTKDVQVIMQAQREYPPSLEDVKDKFLVQYTVTPPGTREVGPDTFDPATNKDIRQTKLRVLLVGPPKPPSPVPEGVEEEVSPAKVAVKDDSAPVSASRGTADSDSFAQERSRLKSDLQKAQKDKADLKKRLDLLELQGQGGGGRRTQQAAAVAGFSTWIVLIVAVLAFLLGKYFAAAGIPKGLSSSSLTAAVNDTLGGAAP